MRIVPPLGSTPVVTPTGHMTEAFRTFTTQISTLGILVGTGSPEGVVEAVVSTQYMDGVGTAGSILYIKRDADIGGNNKLGWILV